MVNWPHRIDNAQKANGYFQHRCESTTLNGKNSVLANTDQRLLTRTELSIVTILHWPPLFPQNNAISLGKSRRKHQIKVQNNTYERAPVAAVTVLLCATLNHEVKVSLNEHV